MSRALLVGTLLLLLGAALRAGDEPPRVEEALQKRINEAIERGTGWLVSKQRKRDGSYPGLAEPMPPGHFDAMDVGLDALVVLTLAHSGVDPHDDAIRKCLDFCRFEYSGGKGSWNLKSSGNLMVYVASTLVLALLAVHAPEAQNVVAKRDRYGVPVPPKPVHCKLPSADRHWIEELVEFLVKAQVKPAGGWRYPGNPVDSVPADTDLSNTQYALLALEAAARCGIDAPDETWKLAAEYLLREQDEDGLEVELLVPSPTWTTGSPEAERFVGGGTWKTRGWCYLPGHPALATGSMTCAGVTGLAMVKERLWARGHLDPELSKRIDRGLLDGLAWLQEHFTVEDNPDPPNQWHYYYLYGLERTGAKTGVVWMGRHDWYREGALHLLAAQTKEGGWRSAVGQDQPADSSESEITQTCFALLFLERATQRPPIPLVPPVVTGGGEAPAEGR